MNLRRIMLLVCLLSLAALTTAACALQELPAAFHERPRVPTITPGVRSTPVPPAMPTAVASLPAPATLALQPVVPTRQAIPILMYHHLLDLEPDASEDLLSYSESPGDFAAQMAYLADQGYHTIHFSDLLAYFNEGRPLPEKPVIITFDDGWADCYTIAYPILQQHGMTATFFIPSNWIENVEGTLTWAQIQEMSQGGIEFGSHSVTHPYLTTSEPDALAWELEYSKQTLEERLGKPVTALAYPFGLYDQTVIEAVQKAGYTSAVTIDPGQWVSEENLFTLKRIGVPYWTDMNAFVAELHNTGPSEEQPAQPSS